MQMQPGAISKRESKKSKRGAEAETNQDYEGEAEFKVNLKKRQRRENDEKVGRLM